MIGTGRFLFFVASIIVSMSIGSLYSTPIGFITFGILMFLLSFSFFYK